MSIPEGQAVYRVRRLYRKGARPRKYRGTFEIADERTQHVEASCDLVGRATFATLEIRDRAGQTWVMKPNRRVAPSRWVVTDPEQRIAAQFTQKALAKLANPLSSVALAMLDADGRETYRLVDARTNLADRIMVAPGEWAIVQGDKPVAKLVSLPRHEAEPRKGLLGVLRKVFAASDHGIVSAGAEHVLEPPVALGTYLLHRELTDSSVGE